MTEEKKEKLKKLGKIALGLGALGAAGAGTYYAAKQGHLGSAAQNFVDHGSTKPLPAPAPAPEPTTKEKMQAALAAAGAKGKEYAGAAADFAREHKGALAGAGAGAAAAGAAGYGVKQFHDALTGKKTDYAYRVANFAVDDKNIAKRYLGDAVTAARHGEGRLALSNLNNARLWGKNLVKHTVHAIRA